MNGLAEIRARWAAASGPFTMVKTPGFVTVWAGDADAHGGFPRDTPVCTFHNRTPGGGNGDPQMVADARFMAAAWTDIQSLLAERERLRAVLSGLLGGMNQEPETRRGTTYRGGFHTEGMYQQAVDALTATDAGGAS